MQKSFKFFDRPELGLVGIIGTTVILTLGEWLFIDWYLKSPSDDLIKGMIILALPCIIIIITMVITCFKRIIIKRHRRNANNPLVFQKAYALG